VTTGRIAESGVQLMTRLSRPGGPRTLGSGTAERSRRVPPSCLASLTNRMSC